jgi:hypothetical protein
MFWVSIRIFNQLMLFGDVIILYCGSHMKHINTLFEEMQSSHFKVGSTYDNHSVLKGLHVSMGQGHPSAFDT